MPSETQKSNNKATQISEMSKTLLFFDGVCTLCNGIVDWLIQNETKHTLYYASLQGSTASELLSDSDRKSLQTLIVLSGGKKFLRSDAVILILKKVGGFFTLLAVVLQLIPRPLRDWGYDLVAKHRYQWFGKKDTCRLPNENEKAQFLP